MSKMKHRPHIMNDVERCTQLLTDESVDLGTLSKETGIAEDTLLSYRDQPDLLKNAYHVRKYWLNISTLFYLNTFSYLIFVY